MSRRAESASLGNLFKRELGGDNILKLERAKQARIEQDEFYEQLTRRNYEKLLEKGTERKLLGGSEDEEN